ncbi:MAG: hypothetical protein WKF31_10820 [Thermoleophilaceae bacterium]
MVGGLAAVIVALALVGRWVEEPLIDWLVPLVDRDSNRGFAVGLASGVAPWSLGWWLLVGRNRRTKRDAPLGDVDDGGFEEVPSQPVATRGRTATTLIAAVLCFATTVPLLILGPVGKNPSRESVRQEREEADRLPGAHDGWLAAMIAGGLLVFGPWGLSSSRRSRR